jgi:hypothetical protein
MGYRPEGLGVSIGDGVECSQLLVNAVIGNLEYWDWTCPVTRTYQELALRLAGPSLLEPCTRALRLVTKTPHESCDVDG